MFNNPLNRKYQTGGPAPTDDERKDMEGFITWIKSNVEGFKDKSTKEIAQSISDMAKSEEGKKSVQNLYSKYQKSKKQKSRFADGGKMQSFICKHAHGGDINCGCKGMVVRAAKGEQLPDGNIFSGWTRNVRRWINLPDGSTQSVETIVSPDGQTGYERIITDRSRMQNRNGMAVRDTSYNGGAYIDGNLYIDASQDLTSQEKSDLNAYLDNKPQSKQEGGPVLTRRQARELSGLNRGYNRSNFQTAMANADLALRNAGLRGKELRQAKRRMVAGINVEPTPEVAFTDNTVPTVVTQPIQEAVALSELPVRTPVIEKPVRPVVRRKPIIKVEQPVVVETAPVDDGEWIFGTHPEYAPRPGRVQIPERRSWFVSALGDARDAKIGAIGAGQVRDLYAEGRDEEAKKLAKNYTIANAVGIAGAAGTQAAVEGLPYIKAAAEKAAAIKRIPSIEEADVLRRAWNNGTGYVPISGFKCGSKIEKHQDDNGIIGHYRNKWSNDWNNIKRGWNNFKDSAIGLVVPTSGTDIALMAAGPMFKIAGKAAKASNAIEAVGDVGRKVLTKTGKSVTIIPEGVYGSEKAAKRALTESAPFISQKGELANEAARNINGLRKWLYGGWYNATTNLPK